MARKINFQNGKPEVQRCEECGRPVHPSLECIACNGGDR